MQFENHLYYNCEITLDTDKVYRVSGNWLHNENLDHWKNWSCAAGQKRLMIDENFNVFSGECLNDHLGNLLETWQPLEQPTICHQQRCSGCTDDLIVEKVSK